MATLQEAYATHKRAYVSLMNEAREHILAHQSLELTPTDAKEHIADIKAMLTEASYHADRMGVLDRIIRKQPLTKG